ncbi:MAG TPA: DUF2442 domain-containing protein [Hyphomicrobiaceae bacterium]|jgi:hypothetical protein
MTMAPPPATSAVVTDDALIVELSDGRSVSAPLAWYPRLLQATAEERRKWRLVAQGEGIHWPDIDEDISVASLIAGRPSTESAASLQRWLAGRKVESEK